MLRYASRTERIEYKYFCITVDNDDNYTEVLLYTYQYVYAYICIYIGIYKYLQWIHWTASITWLEENEINKSNILCKYMIPIELDYYS